MNQPLRIMTWLWRQDPPRADFDAEKVNRWAEMLRPALTVPYSLACVTDIPEGIDSSIDIIPLRDVAPDWLMNLKGPGWDEKAGLPQCYKRLPLWRADAAQLFGGTRLVSMDLDMIVVPGTNLDSAFEHNVELKLLKGTSSKRPYNGGLIQLIAGCRPQVYEGITPEGIAASRKAFVGSDQAWISHVLGWNEQRFGPEEGIYAWTPRFVIANSQRGFLLPGDSRLIFFPANPKPWDMGHVHPRIYAIWTGNAPERSTLFKPVAKSVSRTRLWAYDDPKGWGKEFQKAAKAAGHRAWLFASAQLVADGETAFVRLDQQGAQREISKNILARLAERHIITLPTGAEGVLYDDKAAQLPVLKDWMPQTWLRNSREDAEALLEELSIAGALPIISKASEGAGSANVRVLHTEDEAWAEIVTVFGSGIPLKYGRIQQGAIYWQRLVQDNTKDYRVVVIGRECYGLVRLNRPGTLFASGSGKNYPITLADDREHAAMRLGLDIAKEIGTQWMAFDFVFDGARPLVLEMSSAWTMQSYRDCPVFDAALGRTARRGADSFSMAVDILMSLASAGRKAAA